MQKVFDWSIRWEGETQHNGYSIHIGDTDSYIAIYKPGLKIAPYQRSYAMSGHVNHVGIVVEDLDEIERGYGPLNLNHTCMRIMNPGADFISMMTRG